MGNHLDYFTSNEANEEYALDSITIEKPDDLIYGKGGFGFVVPLPYIPEHTFYLTLIHLKHNNLFDKQMTLGHSWFPKKTVNVTFRKPDYQKNGIYVIDNIEECYSVDRF